MRLDIEKLPGNGSICIRQRELKLCHSVTRWQVILIVRDNTLDGSDCQKQSAFMKESEDVSACVGTSASIFTEEYYPYVTAPPIPTRGLVRISKIGAYGSVKL